MRCRRWTIRYRRRRHCWAGSVRRCAPPSRRCSLNRRGWNRRWATTVNASTPRAGASTRCTRRWKTPCARCMVVATAWRWSPPRTNRMRAASLPTCRSAGCSRRSSVRPWTARAATSRSWSARRCAGCRCSPHSAG
ncbi:hypothetical protein G6F68_012319 [Rhizopus microsporus]|nr:hypothetical protein G6F68_012319 [Rhizopus microsporus]